MHHLKHYRFDFFATSLIFVLIAIFMGPIMLVPLAILAVLEISLSFDNAVVNARVLKRMSEFWQKIFMTVGILIAVVAMRFVFPIAIVSLTAGLGFGEVIDLAFNNPDLYGERLHDAHAEILMLGGTFLMMVFLDFMFEEREVYWLQPIERFLVKIGKQDMLSILIALVVILGLSMTIGGSEQLRVMTAGFISLTVYVALNVLAAVFDSEDTALEEAESSNGGVVKKTGMAAFALFLYLEFQDASFSFDGVSGAFAVTNNIVLIAAGLGIGALFVRSMTVHLVRTDMLAQLKYLEHGAHWAIGALATCMLVSLHFEISEYITGLVGVLFITLAVVHSRHASKKESSIQQTSSPVDEKALVDETLVDTGVNA